MSQVLEYLTRAKEEGASDLFLVAGSPVYLKKGKQLIELKEKLMPQEAEALIDEIYALASNRPKEHYLKYKDDDFAFTVGGVSRFRVNTYHQRGSMAAVVRVVPFGIPDWRERNILPQIMSLAKLTDGLVLVTGTAGEGKSTTQACLINEINCSRPGHIITLEDPIEYLHQSAGYDRDGTRRKQQCIVSQREISIDTEDYPAALRACLRQAPDVILLGEMRDRETIQTAMTAAETGHLVLATLHTKGVVHTVNRIVDAFPGDQQAQIRVQLSMVLKAVVSQQLVDGKDGGSVPAFELMRTNTSVRAHIQQEEGAIQINNDITAGYKEQDETKWMISMNQCLANLCGKGLITEEEARKRAYGEDPELEMDQLLHPERASAAQPKERSPWRFGG